eukprot:TRINITY_DN469_c0_g3_i1.p1 TRINITY_DN469_c0_g3~~TRINITY_DN469_c0_g3_i1.p1  ORF type:complete len:468 (-),score=150.46 TRINITY_DN469_c0_g3_i1:634-1995(-)
MKRLYENYESNNVFLCCGHCISGPDRKLRRQVYFIIIFPLILFITLVLPYLATTFSSIFYLITAILSIQSLFFLSHASCSDPGIIPRAPKLNKQHQQQHQHQHQQQISNSSNSSNSSTFEKNFNNSNDDETLENIAIPLNQSSNFRNSKRFFNNSAPLAPPRKLNSILTNSSSINTNINTNSNLINNNNNNNNNNNENNENTINDIQISESSNFEISVAEEFSSPILQSFGRNESYQPLVPNKNVNDQEMRYLNTYDEKKAARKTKLTQINGIDTILKFCDSCNVWRPPRTSHCRICDNCIERFDHHCIWIGNCIGRRNYQSFLLFLITTTLLLIFVTISNFLQLYFVLGNRDGSEDFWVTLIQTFSQVPPKNTIPSIILGFYGLLIIFPVSGLCFYHLKISFEGITTYEDIKQAWKRGNPHTQKWYNNLITNCFTIYKPPYLDKRSVVNNTI